MRSYSRDKNVVLKVCATKHAVLKCGLKFECYQTCGLTHVTKCGLKSVCYQTCGLKNVVLNLSATKHVVLKCGLKSVSFSAVLILYVRSLFCGLLTKNVVLTQRYPKHAVLKSANISVNKRGETSTFCTTHLH